MKYFMSLGKMIKRPLLLAVVATFAAGCTTKPPTTVQSFRSADAESWVGPAGLADAAGAGVDQRAAAEIHQRQPVKAAYRTEEK